MKVDDGRLAALEERYASIADRVAALEARWQDLSDQYVAWRDQGEGDPELSILEDREFPDAYAVLRAQYEVDLELFALLQSKRHLEDEIALLRSMHDLEDEIAVLRTRPPARADAVADDLSFIPAPVPVARRRDPVRGLRLGAIVLGVVALLAATYALTRGSGEKPTVEVGVPAIQTAPIQWRVSQPKVARERGECRKSAQLQVGKGREHAGQRIMFRIEGPDFRVADDRDTRLGRNGAAKITYETKVCKGSPANSVHLLQVGDDVNVAPKRSR